MATNQKPSGITLISMLPILKNLYSTPVSFFKCDVKQLLVGKIAKTLLLPKYPQGTLLKLVLQDNNKAEALLCQPVSDEDRKSDPKKNGPQ
jgi:hypothetical protein